MPFLPEGGSVEPGVVGGMVGSGLPAARLIVDPDRVLGLKQRIEEERDRIRDWLESNTVTLSHVEPPGADPCSKDSVCALGENGRAAIQAAWGYASQLRKVADALGDIANAYGTTEDQNTQNFPWETR